MKKVFYIPIILVLILAVVTVMYCFKYENSNQEITPNDAEKLCYIVLGEEDEETGFTFSFGFTQTIETEGKKYHVIRASWLVNNSHMSYIGDFFVSTDGEEIYEGTSVPPEYTIGDLIWKE